MALPARREGPSCGESYKAAATATNWLGVQGEIGQVVLGLALLTGLNDQSYLGQVQAS